MTNMIMVVFLFQWVLMHYKADVNAPDNDGNTPLHLCTANGHEKVKNNVFILRVERSKICTLFSAVFAMFREELSKEEHSKSRVSESLI